MIHKLEKVVELEEKFSEGLATALQAGDKLDQVLHTWLA